MDPEEDSGAIGAVGSAGEGSGAAFINEDVLKLFSLWQNEKYSPEILPFDNRVIEDLTEIVEFMGEDLEEERAELDGKDSNDLNHCLRCMDLERIKFVLRDYLRLRIWKITHWPQHYMEPANFDRLSDAERLFLREYWEIKSEFLQHRALGGLPVSKRALDDKLDLLEMVRRPHLDKHVYARFTDENCSLDPWIDPTQSSPSRNSLPTVPYAGQTYLLRYSQVRKYLVERGQEGKVELL